MIELLLEAERALSMGRADRAEVLYEQVVASDPRNSIAVVGLARVALERGHDAGALVLARRALAIDGENVAAQRLVQRLEEVLQTRGEALPAVEAAPPVARTPPAEAAPPVLPAPPAEAAPPVLPAPTAEAMPVDDVAAAWAAAAKAGPWAAAAPPSDDAAASPQPAPAPPRPTPFDGPDPVLGPADHPSGTLTSSAGDAESAPRTRRSILDRLRGR